MRLPLRIGILELGGVRLLLISEQSCGDRSPLSEPRAHPTPSHPTLAPGVSKVLSLEAEGDLGLGLRSAHPPSYWGSFSSGGRVLPFSDLKEVSGFLGWARLREGNHQGVQKAWLYLEEAATENSGVS